MTNALEKRVEKLEQAAGGGTRYFVYGPGGPSPEQQAEMDRLDAEGVRIIGVRDPYVRVVTDILEKDWDR